MHSQELSGCFSDLATQIVEQGHVGVDDKGLQRELLHVPMELAPEPATGLRLINCWSFKSIVVTLGRTTC